VDRCDVERSDQRNDVAGEEGDAVRARWLVRLTVSSKIRDDDTVTPGKNPDLVFPVP